MNPIRSFDLQAVIYWHFQGIGAFLFFPREEIGGLPVCQCGFVKLFWYSTTMISVVWGFGVLLLWFGVWVILELWCSLFMCEPIFPLKKYHIGIGITEEIS